MAWQLTTVFLKFPLAIVQRTNLTCFQPPRDAMKVKCLKRKTTSKARENHQSSLTWLHTPQATVHSSVVAAAWFAWHSIHKSMMWFRQIAQLSTTISQAHRVTAFHFFTSKRLRCPTDVSVVVEPLGKSASSVFIGVGSDEAMRWFRDTI